MFTRASGLQWTWNMIWQESSGVSLDQWTLIPSQNPLYLTREVWWYFCWRSSSPKIDWAQGETGSSLTEPELDFKASSFVRSSLVSGFHFYQCFFFFSCRTLYVYIWFKENSNQSGCVCNVCWSAELCSWITSLLFCTSAISFMSALLTAWKTKLLFKCWINYT